MDGLRQFARAFVELQVRTAVDRQVASWKSANNGVGSLDHASSTSGSKAEPPKSPPDEIKLNSKAPDHLPNDWIERIQTLVTEVLNTALQNTTAVLADRHAGKQQRQHKPTERHHHLHKRPQLTRESVDLVYNNILNQALARVVSHLCQAPSSTTAFTVQQSDSAEETQDQSPPEPEQPMELSTTEDRPNQQGLRSEQCPIELSDGPVDDDASSSHRHHHKHRNHHHKRRVFQTAEHFCDKLLAEAVLRLASRSSNDASQAVAQVALEGPELLPGSPSDDLDVEQTQPQLELSDTEAPCASTDESSFASTETASTLDDFPPGSCSKDDEPAPESLLIQEPAVVIPLPPRTSSSDRRKRDAMAFDAKSRRLCSSVAETFVTGLLAMAVALPRFMEKAPAVAPQQVVESISEPAPPPSAPERPVKGRASPERRAKSREKDLPPPEVLLTTAKSFSSSESTSFVLPPLILPPTRDRTPPPPLEPVALSTKEHKKKARSKDHNHQKPVAKSSNDLTLELKIEHEADIASCESPAAITARAAAFLYQPRSAASLPGQHVRRQDTLDPVMKISHSRDSPRAAMLANAKITTSKSALLRPIAVPSPVVLPPSPTRERPSKERTSSPTKASSPAKKRSGFCQMCVLEGRSCKINDCLKHQLLK